MVALRRRLPPSPGRPVRRRRDTGGMAAPQHALSICLLVPAIFWAWAFPAVGPFLAASLLLYYLVALRYPIVV